MILLGFLLILVSAGLSIALLWANDSVFTAPAPVLDLFGYQVHTTVAQIFLAGVVVGAATVLGLVMLVSAIGRNAVRRSTARHQLRSDRRDEIQDRKREHDAAAEREVAERDAANRDAANRDAADSKGITSSR